MESGLRKKKWVFSMQSFWDYEERSTIFSFGSTVTLYHLKYMYIHNILKYYIFSSRNELYHSLRRLVLPLWVLDDLFCFLVISFATGKENMCPFERSAWHWRWKASYRWTPGIWGIKTTESRASFCFYQMAQGSTSSWFIVFYPVQY